MTESESTGTRPDLPRLGVPRRADLEDFFQAVRRVEAGHGYTRAEAFEVLRLIVPLAVERGARFYCGGYAGYYGPPVTPLSPDDLYERLEQISADLRENDPLARRHLPAVVARPGDLALLIKIAFDPSDYLTT